MGCSCWALVGPTAVGKTSVAVELARMHPVQIIGLDSRQIYKFMDIGTAKPTPEERALVPHHMIDLVDPGTRWDAMSYARNARDAIVQLAAGGFQPLAVGGTGFYLEALMGHISEGFPGASAAVRRVLREELAESGIEAMWSRLEELDAETASRVSPRDTTRVIRALEIIETAGKPMSRLAEEHPPKPWGTWHIVVLNTDRETLKARIRERVEQMIACGWLEEVKGLLDAGYDESAPGMSSLGYAEMIAVAKGVVSLEDAKKQISFRTWRYAKRQLTWFRRFPKERWIMVERDPATTAQAVAAFLAKQRPLEV